QRDQRRRIGDHAAVRQLSGRDAGSNRVTLRILGAGGHAKVALEAWRSSGGTAAAMFDDDVARHGQMVLGVAVVGAIETAIPGSEPLHIAIGDNGGRATVASMAEDTRFPLVTHIRSWISPSATLGAGALVCAGAIVQAEARVGRHVIVN